MVPGSAWAQTVNLLVSATNFASLPAATCGVQLTPAFNLAPQTNFIGIPVTITGFTDTNGNYTFSNVLAGYTYKLAINYSFGTFTTNIGLPSGLSGTVAAAAYQGIWLPGQQLFAYTSTNFFGQYVPLNASTNLIGFTSVYKVTDANGNIRFFASGGGTVMAWPNGVDAVTASGGTSNLIFSFINGSNAIIAGSNQIAMFAPTTVVGPVTISNSVADGGYGVVIETDTTGAHAPPFGIAVGSTDGNPFYNDAFTIGIPYNTVHGKDYADISIGSFPTNNRTLDINDGFIQSMAFGICSSNGNWTGTTPLNAYGVGIPGMVNLELAPFKSFTIFSDVPPGSMASSGFPSAGGDPITPQFVISTNGIHILFMDWGSGTTNLFDFDKSNGAVNIPFGPTVANGFITTNGGVFTGNGSGLAALNITNTTLPSGLSQVGGTSMNTTITDTEWDFNHGPGEAANFGDHPFHVADWSTNMIESGSQIGLSTMIQDGNGNPQQYSINSVDFAAAPANRIVSLTPATISLVFNRDQANVKAFYIGGPGIAQNDPGNGSLVMFDFYNAMFEVPLTSSGVYAPWDISFTITPSNNLVNPPCFQDYYSNATTGINYEVTYANGSPGATLAFNVNPTFTGTLTKTSGGTGDSSISYSSSGLNSLTGAMPLSYKFTVSGITATPAIGQTYRAMPFNYVYTVSATNVTGTSPNISGNITLTINPALPATGTLSKVTVGYPNGGLCGDSVITYTSYTTNVWRNALSVNPATGVVAVSNTLVLPTNVLLNVAVGNVGQNIITNVSGVNYIEPGRLSPNGQANINNLFLGAANGANAISFNGSIYLVKNFGDFLINDNNGTSMHFSGTGGNSYVRIEQALNLGWGTDGAGNIGSATGAVTGSGVGRPANIWAMTNVEAPIMSVATNNAFATLTATITNGQSGIVISNTTGTAYTYLITSRPGATNRQATLLGTSP